MADAADTPQLLDVDVDQLTGAISLVTASRLFGLEAIEAREALAGQDTGHRGARQTHPYGDLRAGVAASSQSDHLFDPIQMNLPWHPVRARTAIDQRRLAALPVSRLPLEGSPSRQTGRLGGAGHRHPSLDPTNQEHSTGRTASGILVKLHLGSFVETVALDTSSLTEPSPDGQQTYQ